MKESIRQRLELCKTLPSLPSAAIKIVELASDPGSGMRDIADVICTDPALSAKILRMANSSLYSRQSACDTFQQALVRLGLNATVSLSLTFSLANVLAGTKQSGLNYEQVWKRALFTATSARVLGTHFGLKDVEDIFLAGLMQDIGLLALDTAFPQLYEGLEDCEQEHDQLFELERRELETDHAEVGRWLMDRWRLPHRIVDAIGASHCIDEYGDGDEAIRFRQAVSLSGPVADLWMSAAPEQCLTQVQNCAIKIDGLNGECLPAVLQGVADAAPEIERLFETNLMDPIRSEWILTEARETLLLRNLQMVQESVRLREVAASLEAQAKVLEEKSKHDNLTGAVNRGHLDAMLSEWFSDVNVRSGPLSLLFLDLDNFKQVNDHHGHHVGDQVLSAYGSRLLEITRGCDLVGRYGGEEFVILLRDCDAEGARQFCHRLIEHCRALEVALDDNASVRVTPSLGVATHGETVFFSSAADLLRAADEAVIKPSARARTVMSFIAKRPTRPNDSSERWKRQPELTNHECSC